MPGSFKPNIQMPGFFEPNIQRQGIANFPRKDVANFPRKKNPHKIIEQRNWKPMSIEAVPHIKQEVHYQIARFSLR